MNIHDVCSASLSRVTCSFCGGRLHTHHKPGCPVPAAQARDREKLLATMLRGVR